jgi:UDP-N-acetylglucosamine 2-epimerase (non-hydrolysing)
LHTGQHFDHNLRQIFFDELQLDQPDIYLDAQGNTQVELMADIMIKFEKELLKIKPDIVLVPGDVNSSVACALVASRNGFKIGHIESGLRSFDREMPEEINRILIDDLADFLLVTEQSGIDHLNHEGKDNKKIHLVGNTMIDSLVAFTPHIDQSKILDKLNLQQAYGVMTFHRPSNVDNLYMLEELIKSINACSKDLTIVFPVHPRTKNSLVKFGLWDKLNSIENLIIEPSLGYLDFMKLIKNAKVVITDSGGIQEETTFLQIPCLTVRENTERPVTIELGTNHLLSLNAQHIAKKLASILSSPHSSSIPPLWDGEATHRILSVLA